jgi:hypothetical protein
MKQITMKNGQKLPSHSHIHVEGLNFESVVEIEFVFNFLGLPWT